MKRISLFIDAVIFGLMFLAIGQARALTITPVKFELSADPGDVLNGTITLINEQKWEMIFYPTFERFTVRGSYGEPMFTGEKTGLASWIEASPSKVVLGPGLEAKTSFFIRVPQDAEPGGHYAVIFWGTTPPEGEQGGGGLGVASRLGVLILLNVSGDVVESAEILNFRANRKIFNYLPVELGYEFKNNGTVHLKPAGNLIIKNILGKTKVVLPVNPQSFNVLPNSARTFSVIWQTEKTDGQPESEAKGFFAKLKKERSGFAFGYYRAVLNLEFGQKKETAEASFGFWLLPWRILLISAIGLGILCFLITLGVRRYNRWIVSKAVNKAKRSRRARKSN